VTVLRIGRCEPIANGTAVLAAYIGAVCGGFVVGGLLVSNVQAGGSTREAAASALTDAGLLSGAILLVGACVLGSQRVSRMRQSGRHSEKSRPVAADQPAGSPEVSTAGGDYIPRPGDPATGRRWEPGSVMPASSVRRN
jgi:hypothetical protein